MTQPTAIVTPWHGLRSTGDPHCRWPFQRGAVGIERWPVRHGIAGSAVPADVSASAVSQAGDVPDEDLIRAEWVPVWAAGGWSGDPPTGRGLHQVAQHIRDPRSMDRT